MQGDTKNKWLKWITIIIAVVAIVLVIVLLLRQFGIIGKDGEGIGSIGFFFPGDGTFDDGGGSYDNGATTTNETEGGAGSHDTPLSFPRLRKLTNTPTAGAISFRKGDDILVRYVEVGTGDIYELNMNSSEPVRLVQQNLSNIHDALWRSDGSGVIIRYLDSFEIIRLLLVSVPETPLGEGIAPTTKLLSLSSSEVVPSSVSGSMVYTLTEGETTSINRSAFGVPEDRSVLIESPFSEWLIDWPSDGNLTLTTKPSYNIDGYAYSLSEDGGISKLLGPHGGLLTKISPRGSYVAYTKSDQSGISLNFLNVSLSTTMSAPLQTVADKCSWGLVESDLLYCGVPVSISANGTPDSWYKGTVTYTDTLWKINAADPNTPTQLSVLAQEGKEEIDLYKPFVERSDTYLYFFNKKDLCLWSFEVARTEP